MGRDNVKLTINEKIIIGSRGDTLLNAALANGIVLPQDCCSGQCGTCRVEVKKGNLDDCGTREGNSVLSCMSRLTDDVEIYYEPQPVPIKTNGIITSVTAIGGDIFEIIVETKRSIPYLPGQYVKVTFQGLPVRDYSPTLTLDGFREINQLIFHIRKLPNSEVSSHLGTKIIPGKSVKINGPFGHAFLRYGEGRIILVSSGTGFAPIWSIAVAARLGQPHRELNVIASARDPRNLYMRRSFEWLAKQGVTELTLSASGASSFSPVKQGRATEFLPILSPNDTVYACGNPQMVEAVKEIATKTKAKFYADPFYSSTATKSMKKKILGFFKIK